MLLAGNKFTRTLTQQHKLACSHSNSNVANDAHSVWATCLLIKPCVLRMSRSFDAKHIAKCTAGVPEPYEVCAKSNEEAGLLSISKLRFQELTAAYPEQLESMTTSLLSQHGLKRSGDDTLAVAARGAQEESETELMRVALKARSLFTLAWMRRKVYFIAPFVSQAYIFESIARLSFAMRTCAACTEQSTQASTRRARFAAGAHAIAGAGCG